MPINTYVILCILHIDKYVRICYNVLTRQGKPNLSSETERMVTMKMPSQTEALIQITQENERRKILEIVKECKSLDEAVNKIQSMNK